MFLLKEMLVTNIYKVKGIDSLIFEVLYLKDTKQVLVKAYDCSMSVVFE